MEINKPNIIYKTFSVCPQCAILESTMALKSAEVVSSYNKVWMQVRCNIHGNQVTLLSSNVDWFERMWKFQSTDLKDVSIPDMEDLKQKRKMKTANLPLVVELNVFVKDQFLKEEEIESQLRKIQLTFPKDIEYMIKVSAKRSDDMDILNKLVLFIHTKTNMRVLVQVSFERLVILSKLEDSCFLKPRIYPAIKYFVNKGEEKHSMDEVGQAIAALKAFQNMKLVVSLTIENPLPDLSSLLAYLRMQRGLVKVIEIILERSPKTITNGVKTPSMKEVPPEMAKFAKVENKKIYTDSNPDPYEVMKMIQEATNKTISIDDFFPMSMAQIFEPVLPILGIGKYLIRPSPYCGYVYYRI
eukprot:TRINITY_DN6121_c0_g1_i1.p1 TRINITY_DN6121_c0_g1~~TRINITY_DN6121_c0_g1_i1.p1  ORF type:complete len:356 (+),score=52.42 TRINITY_DN6121_c0_g1_i1:75-1142(+)